MAAYSVLSIMVALLLVQRLTVAANTRSTAECHTNINCPSKMICEDQRCIDPCSRNACGANAVCVMKNHVAHCSCQPGYVGHPFEGCYLPSDMAEKDGTTPKTLRKKKYHLHYDEKLSWYDALNRCKELGMRLATIHGEKGTEKLAELIREAGLRRPGHSRWWLGGSDLGKERTYAWYSSNEPLTYKNFEQGQPDNYVYEDDYIEHCIELRERWNFKWNDYVCDEPQYYICEELL